MYHPLFLPQRYLHNRNEVSTPITQHRGRREWIVSRGLCHYRLFNLQEIPVNHRVTVLMQQIRQWSPFPEYASYIVWQDMQALVWIWDKQRQQQAWSEIGIKSARLLPETVLRPRPQGETVQLLRCLDGVEGQIWYHGLLTASRWWAETPLLAEWNSFLRAHSLAATSHVPVALETALLPQPWGKPKSSFNALNLRQERFWVFIGVAILLIVLTWQTISIWKWQQSLAHIQTQIDTLSENTTPVLHSRTEAQTDKQTVEQLMTLNAYPTQLELLAQVAEKLPRGPYIKLVEWIYQTGELRFTIEATHIDPRFYVEAFQSVPLFQEVKSENGNQPNQIIMNMRITH